MKKGEYTIKPANFIKCDYCDMQALYDGKTKIGSWAYMCALHFKIRGVGLGLGRGQKFVTEKELVSFVK